MYIYIYSNSIRTSTIGNNYYLTAVYHVVQISYVTCYRIYQFLYMSKFSTLGIYRVVVQSCNEGIRETTRIHRDRWLSG
jgi:hypothetical protein